MRSRRRSTLFFIVLLAAAPMLGCDAPTRPATDLRADASGEHGTTTSATGGGWYDLNNLFQIQFAFSAIQKADGSVMGRFHHRTDTGAGTFDIHASVTCLAVDPDRRRAWIGGVITRNNSTDPFYQQAIYQPGHDAWFRVVDYGEGNDAPADRSTFIGFENTPGIPTSEAYCALRPWPVNDARTWPQTAGNIQVRGAE